MTRNILATCPRVTRFRIDWNDNPAEGAAGTSGGAGGENTENQPPPYNTESESNQMGGMELGGGGDSLKGDKDSSSNMMPPSSMSNGFSSSEKVVLNGSTADGSNMDLGGGGGFAPKTTTDSREEPSAMEMWSRLHLYIVNLLCWKRSILQCSYSHRYNRNNPSIVGLFHYLYLGVIQELTKCPNCVKLWALGNNFRR